jgi:transposase
METKTAWEQRIRFSDSMWSELEKAFPVFKRGRPSNTRNFLEAVYFRFRTGIPWRDLPPDFGPWKAIFNRFNRWSKLGYFDAAFEAVKKNWQ